MWCARHYLSRPGAPSLPDPKSIVSLVIIPNGRATRTHYAVPLDNPHRVTETSSKLLQKDTGQPNPCPLFHLVVFHVFPSYPHSFFSQSKFAKVV